MDLWTQRYAIQWAPVLSFYETRYAVLRSFEEQGLLRQFRIGGDDVGARLGDPHHVLTFGEKHLNALVLSPKADQARVMNAARAVLDALRPSRMARVSVGLQWLGEVNANYDEARNTAASRLFGSEPIDESLGGTAVADYALLMDGEHPEGTYNVEAGVVRAEEIPDRFSRREGRMGVDPETPSSIWPLDTLPKVAYFADMQWWSKERPTASTEGVIDAWHQARENATSVASGLFTHLGAE